MSKTAQKIKRSQKKQAVSKKKSIFTNKGFSGFFVIVAVIFAVFLAGAFSAINTQNPVEGIPDPNNPFRNATDKKTLQLRTLGFITVTPTPSSAPITNAPTALCQNQQINDEPEILAGYLPSQGQSVVTGGQIKVWINDEGAPIISQGETLDPASGLIKTAGNRTAKAPDGYLWEPALYIAPQTAENGGTPHFPTAIKGNYNNQPGTELQCGPNIPGIEPVPGNPSLKEPCTAEDIWDVNSLGLAPGTYEAEFVIHDGDHNRGIGCVTITIQ